MSPVDRRSFTPLGDDPPHAVVVSPTCTVPTKDMAERLARWLDTTGDVLEVGTGSGFQAAILAEKCRTVTSMDVELFSGLAEKLPENVVIFQADGLTHDTGEQFDGILVTCGVPELMPVWGKQLKEGGRLIVPLQGQLACAVCVYEKRDGKIVLFDIPAYANFTQAVM